MRLVRNESETEEMALTNEQTSNHFIERHNLKIDEVFDYPRTGSNPGIILIFNYTTTESGERAGSEKDFVNLRDCFFRLGFNVNDDDVCSNYRLKAVVEKLDKVLEDKEKLKNSNSLIVVFMSHGHANEELETVDQPIKTTDIWGKFAYCEELRNKPKMFIFQACKGDSYSSVKGETKVEEHEYRNKELVKMHYFHEKMGNDMLLVYSSTEGNVSYRRKNGSWFIKELATNFTKYGSKYDVLSILLRVTKCVATYFALDGEIHQKETAKQMPVFISTLSKKFYLTRSKERHEKLIENEALEDLEKLVKKRLTK